MYINVYMAKHTNTVTSIKYFILLLTDLIFADISKHSIKKVQIQFLLILLDVCFILNRFTGNTNK